MEAKSILAVHDLSCHGTASLGIVIPVLTALGHKVIALPSVVLSSTTDLDHQPAALSTTGWWGEVVKKMKEKEVGFDAIFTGWLGDPDQIPILVDLCKGPQNRDAIIFIDPVLGDCGVLYPSQAEMVERMKELVALADVITPNPTEAAILVGKNPEDFGIGKTGTIEVEDARQLLQDLVSCYPKTLPILKSVVFGKQIGVFVFFNAVNTSGAGPRTQLFMSERVGLGSVGGTGDLFASLLIGKWLNQINGKSGDYEKAILIQSVVQTMTWIIGKTGESKDLPFRDLLRCL